MAPIHNHINAAIQAHFFIISFVFRQLNGIGDVCLLHDFGEQVGQNTLELAVLYVGKRSAVCPDTNDKLFLTRLILTDKLLLSLGEGCLDCACLIDIFIYQPMHPVALVGVHLVDSIVELIEQLRVVLAHNAIDIISIKHIQRAFAVRLAEGIGDDGLHLALVQGSVQLRRGIIEDCLVGEALFLCPFLE